MKHVLVLHNIRSAQNVGSIFRTADAAGLAQIYLCGYTPNPIDRFGRARTDIAKASLGAERTVQWEHVDDISVLLSRLKKEKYQIIAIEQNKKALDYKKIKPSGKVAFILGNEVEGLPPDVLKEADMIAEIPMRGKKESLNVGVAAGIALFRILGI